VVTYIPAVLTPGTGIKVRSGGQAVKSEMIKRSRRPFALIISRSSPLTPPTPRPLQLAIKGQDSFSSAIKRSRSKNGRDQILIPVAGVSTVGIYVITPCGLDHITDCLSFTESDGFLGVCILVTKSGKAHTKLYAKIFLPSLNLFNIDCYKLL
jgi:hypothetical protein